MMRWIVSRNGNCIFTGIPSRVPATLWCKSQQHCVIGLGEPQGRTLSESTKTWFGKYMSRSRNKRLQIIAYVVVGSCIVSQEDISSESHNAHAGEIDIVFQKDNSKSKPRAWQRSRTIRLCFRNRIPSSDTVPVSRPASGRPSSAVWFLTGIHIVIGFRGAVQYNWLIISLTWID